MTGRFKNLAKNSTLALGTFVVCFLLLELTLRVAGVRVGACHPRSVVFIDQGVKSVTKPQSRTLSATAPRS